MVINNKQKIAFFVGLGAVLLVLITLGLISESEQELERGKVVSRPTEYRSINPLKGLKSLFSSGSRSSFFSKENTELIHTRVQRDGLDVEIARVDSEQMKNNAALEEIVRESTRDILIYSFTLRAIDDCIPKDISQNPRQYVFLNDREGRKIDPSEIPQFENRAKIIYKSKICGSRSAPVYMQYYAAYPRMRLPVSFSLQDSKGSPAVSHPRG